MSDKLVVSSRPEALDLIERFIEEQDETILLPYVRGMTASNDEKTYGIMSISGNEMSIRHKFLYLIEKAGLVTQAETFSALDRYREASKP